MSFEEGTKKLEEIIAKLDDDKTTLEESIKLFEEGVVVSKSCMEILNESKGKITIIKQDFDSLMETPFDPNAK